MSEEAGTPFSYTESERLGKRIAALIRNGFSPSDAAHLAVLELGIKPGPNLQDRRRKEKP